MRRLTGRGSESGGSYPAAPFLLALLAWLGSFAAAAVLAAAQTQGPGPGSPLAPTDVSVALVLAVDTSGSVSMGRFELQKQGYAAAFRNPQVLNAIRSLGTQSIAVTMFQWTGPLLHVIAAGWTLIKDQESAAAFAGAVAAAPRRLFGGGTSISGAIDYARVLLAAGPYKGTRRVIDVSGDGSNNSGRAAQVSHSHLMKIGGKRHKLGQVCAKIRRGRHCSNLSWRSPQRGEAETCAAFTPMPSIRRPWLSWRQPSTRRG